MDISLIPSATSTSLMSDTPQSRYVHDRLASKLTAGEDYIDPGHWTPPRSGIIPHVRIGARWVNVLWALPIGAALLLVVVGAAQALRELATVQAFILQYPGMPGNQPGATTGFPWWLRLQHFVNMFFMLFIMRAGIQILADHPRLYWKRDSTPGTEWFRFQKDVPADRIWTAKDDAVTLPKWLGIPGLRHTIGLARWWHFSVNMLWLLNGIAFYVLLFATDQWVRLVPVTWDVFPHAASTALQYASLTFPSETDWTRYNSLQQLTYFTTVFIAAPISIFTGLMQAPAISNRLGWLGKVFHRQIARSIHFIAFIWFLCFIAIHGALVVMTGLRRNTNHMFAGVDDHTWAGLLPFTAAMAILCIAWAIASPMTIRHARRVQQVGRFMVGWWKGLLEYGDPTLQLTEKDISPRFWPNGTMPTSVEYEALASKNFSEYRLRVGGLVKRLANSRCTSCSR